MPYRFLDALIELPDIGRRYSMVSIPFSAHDDPFPEIESLAFEGVVIACPLSEEVVGPLLNRGVPVVNLASEAHASIHSVALSDRALADEVVRHACYGGFEKVVFLYTTSLRESSEPVLESFLEACTEAGCDFDALGVEEKPFEVSTDRWVEAHPEFMKQLGSEEKRTLYYTFHDGRALLVVELCQRLGIDVPGAVGVLGRGDTLQVRFAPMGVSSVAMPWFRMAQSAIDLIDRGLTDGQRVRLKPGRVVLRASTVHGKEDVGELMEKVARLVEQGSQEELSVEDLARAAGVSRSTLERRYFDVHGELPSVALRRGKLQRGAQLLKETNMTVEGVAHAVGYASVRAFSVAFQKEYTVSPGRWRRTLPLSFTG
ncbi:helix-turn-helix domain-containing protein [Rubritalea tangerina]